MLIAGLLIVVANSCLKTIIESSFEKTKDIVVVGQIFDQTPTPHVPIYATTVDHLEIFTNQKNFLIHIQKTCSLTDLFQKLKPHGRYVFVGEDLLVEQIFQLAQNHSIEKLLAVDQSRVFFKDKKTIRSSESCEYDPKIFDRRLQFSGKLPLKVAYLLDTPFVINPKGTNPGVMVSMFNLIQRTSGIVVDYSTNCSTFQEELLTNGTLHGISRALQNGQVDVALGRLTLNDSETAPFDFGPVLYNDDLRLSGPKPKPKKSYRKLFIVFNKEIWLYVLYGVLGMTFLFYIFSLIEDYQKTALLDVMLHVFQILIGCGLGLLPKTAAFRVLFAFFFLFSMCMDSIYLGNLSNIFAGANYEINMKDMNAVKMTKAKFVYDWRTERFLILHYVYRHKPQDKASRLFVTNHTQSFLINHTALAKDNATILFQSVLDSFPTHGLMLDHFNVMTVYLSLYVTFYVRKNIECTEGLLFWAREIVEKGFVQKWFKDIAWSNVNTTILPPDEKKLVVLKLAHFEESFLVLLGGYGVAFVGFLLEFVFQQLEVIGLVQKFRDGVIFLVGLLKPPKL